MRLAKTVPARAHQERRDGPGPLALPETASEGQVSDILIGMVEVSLFTLACTEVFQANMHLITTIPPDMTPHSRACKARLGAVRCLVYAAGVLAAR